jgi:S1-C subfamily serine protease
MQRILIFLFIALPVIACANEAETRFTLSANHLDALEAATIKQAATLRTHSVMIGRLGLADVRPGVLLTDEGHVLSPYMAPIDETPAPYLVQLADGSRLTPEVIFEDEKRKCVLLKLPNGAPKGKTPVRIAPKEITASEQAYFLLLDYGPSPQRNEPATIQRAYRIRSESDNNHRFTLRSDFRSSGHALFDLAGRLIGQCKHFEDNTALADAISLTELTDTWPALAELLPEPTAAPLPEFPILPDFVAPTEDDPRIAKPLHGALLTLLATDKNDPTVAIINDGKSPWHAIQGVILSTNGLVLSKASELGPSLTCQFQGRDYPATLLATDEATDLALLAISPSKNLPIINWSDTAPEPGTGLHSPLSNPPSPGGAYDGDSVATGQFSHRLKNVAASHRSLHAPEDTTTLGIVPEQLKSDLRIAALFPEGPAAKGGLYRGDVIRTLNDQPVTTRTQLADALAQHHVGDEVTLGFERDGNLQSTPLLLGPARLAPPPSGELPPAILTIPSIRRSGFTDAMVHTTPLEAWQCGGPIYDHEGRAVGINIARAAFGRTLALPPTVIKEAINRMIQRSNAF